MKTTHLAHGILERAGRVLLVASRYANHATPLWNLPGGRARDGELLDAAVRREFFEETQLSIEVSELRYVAESFDPVSATHFVAFVFSVSARGEPSLGIDAHVVQLDWVALDHIAARVTVPVVRDPLVTHLRDPSRRYFARADAGITIEFADDP